MICIKAEIPEELSLIDDELKLLKKSYYLICLKIL